MRWKNPVTDIPNAIKNASAKAIISNITGRAVAKTIISSLNPNCPSGEERTSDARPYENAVFSNYAAVGAAIGRPSIN